MTVIVICRYFPKLFEKRQRWYRSIW